MLKGFILSFFILLSFTVQSQIAKDLTIGGGLDLIKTDNDEFFEKFQIGLEANYFFTRQFTGSAGVELWTDDEVSFVIGGRWYPIDEAFVRVRGLIGVNDVSIGGGWAKPLNENWKLEALGDFYFEGEFAIRVGAVYVIRRKE
jgi:hypothetical protein